MKNCGYFLRMWSVVTYQNPLLGKATLSHTVPPIRNKNGGRDNWKRDVIRLRKVSQNCACAPVRRVVLWVTCPRHHTK